MKSFTFESIVPESLDKVWDAISDVSSYPQRMKYIQHVKLHGNFEEGSMWEDRHSIMFLPLTTPHIIKKLTHQKEVTYELKFPLNGTMLQHLEIQGDHKETKVHITVHYTLGNPLLNVTLGKILERRLKNLFHHTFRTN